MKAFNRQKILYFGILLFLSVSSLAQWEEDQINAFITIPEVALVDIEPSFNNTVHFAIIPSSEAGESPQVSESSGETLWINYSSALSNESSSRQIVAEIAQGNLPEGISLFVEASSYSGNGSGNLGQPSGKVNISSQRHPVLSGIGNCYTGDGLNNGHSLTFSLEIQDYSKISVGNETAFTILYTISDI